MRVLSDPVGNGTAPNKRLDPTPVDQLVAVSSTVLSNVCSQKSTVYLAIYISALIYNNIIIMYYKMFTALWPWIDMGCVR